MQLLFHSTTLIVKSLIGVSKNFMHISACCYLFTEIITAESMQSEMTLKVTTDEPVIEHRGVARILYGPIHASKQDVGGIPWSRM